ncbi:MAG: hypothetical protein BWK80_04385 [Desulfobacteraceae bacterium IS3]|nr:MAG: hypothetical protein BWK80_04385 [Desulfobacteraceae bacterium IS3]
MSKDSKEHLLEYYQRELTYLRRRGSEFAKQYPKVAGRLELGMDGSPDPHIERMLESFAFLTARIQYNLESEFPLLSTALLGVLYPQFLNPVPSMSVARFELDPTQVKLTSAYLIPKHTSLKTRQNECRFRTSYPVELWPMEVGAAEFMSPDKFDFIKDGVSTVLRLHIVSQGEAFSNLLIPRLRFYLNGDRILVNTLYEHLFSNVLRIVISADGKPVLNLPADAILPVGFRSDEDVLPYPANAHSAYRLLHEYFTFPEKFLFFDLDFQKSGGFSPHSLPRDTASFDILIMMDQMPKTSLTVDKNTFCLGCTPIINLFPKTTEPIRIDERHAEYLLIPDQRREKTTEIHSIVSVSTVSESDDASGTLAPFFSFTHQVDKKDNATLAFWQGRREPTGRKEVPGTQMFLSFVDLGFNPAVPPAKTVFAHTLCTNRNLAEEVPVGALLQIEKTAPVSDIFTLTKPTPRIDPPMEGAALWRLISHLSLNYLSLGESADSLKALQEILRLYDVSEHSDTAQQIAGIKDMSCRKVVRRIGTEAWRGFCRGIEITMTFNEREYVGTSAFLFASVLNSFFPLYTSVNSFTRLVIKSEQRKGVWKAWPPTVGEQIVL